MKSPIERARIKILGIKNLSLLQSENINHEQGSWKNEIFMLE